MPHSDPVEAQRYNREYKRRNRWRYAPTQSNYDRAKHANERAAKYGCQGTVTPDEVTAVMAACRCHYCSTTDGLMTLDHVVPLHAGGINRPENMVCACRPCNISKYRQDRPHRWARQHDRCIDCSTTDYKHCCKGRCVPCHNRWYNARRESRSGRSKPKLSTLQS